MFQKIIALIFLASATTAFLQEFTMYTEIEFGGDALRFRSHKSNLSDYAVISRVSYSVCSTGFWFVFTSPNYQDYFNNFGDTEGTKFCFTTTTMQTANSIRHLGAEDTTTPALSLYSGENFQGTEHYVNTTSANIPFQVRSLATTGKSNWTFYAQPNYQGNSTCVQAGRDDIMYLPKYFDTVQSVSFGCNLTSSDRH